MTPLPGALVVFVGPSLDHAQTRQLLPTAHITQPIGRGDLERLTAEGARRFLIIDGVFAQRLAVAPSEIVAALRDGAQILGAASIGAVRAAECWPAGMHGVGAVYQLYRMRVIANDDEVAVAVDPERGFAAVSIALIQIRYGLLAALRQQRLTRAEAAAVLAAAKRAHFSERRLETTFASAGVPITPQLRRIFEISDVKRRDALCAAERVASLLPQPSPAPTAARPQLNRTRAVGHDARLGYSLATLRREVPQWLLGSGRYRRYLAPEQRSCDCVRMSADLWSTLARGRALDAEIMRWHAVQRASAVRPDSPDDRWVREAHKSVAALHGFGSWEELCDSARNGQLAGVPLEWVERACRSLALARRNLHVIQRTRTAVAS
jgi:hypothetical protein